MGEPLKPINTNPLTVAYTLRNSSAARSSNAHSKTQKKWSDEGIPETQVLVLGEAGVRELLDHSVTMTDTLRTKVNDSKPIEVNKILGPFDDDKGIRTRVVVLRDTESKRILSLGLIKIDLNNLSPEFIKELGETYTPFGELLTKYNVPAKGNVQKFYKMSTPEQKREKLFFLKTEDEKNAFCFHDSTDIYGRFNVLRRTDNGKRVARVYEFLAADSKVRQ